MLGGADLPGSLVEKEERSFFSLPYPRREYTEAGTEEREKVYFFAAFASLILLWSVLFLSRSMIKVFIVSAE